MVLLCDGCDDDISKLSRPECYLPLSGRGGIDLCPECKDELAKLFGGDDE